MKLLLYFLVPSFSLLSCQLFQPTNWTTCSLIHQYFKLLKPGFAVSPVHCLTQCSCTLGCVAALWKRTWPSCTLASYTTKNQNDFAWKITEGKFYVQNKTTHCHTTGMDTGTIANQNSITTCTSAKYANASSYFLDNTFTPCTAFKDDNKVHYKSNQSLETIPEWWYDLQTTCYVVEIKCRQQISSIETLAVYVLQDLTHPRDAKTFCTRGSGAQDKDILLTCIGLSEGRYVLIKKDIPGLLAISHVEIYGLC